MLVVLLVTSWAALDTSLSPHDSTSLMKSGGNLSKGCESVWEREQISKKTNLAVTYFLAPHLHVYKMLNYNFDDLQNSGGDHFLNHAGEH